jgi:hypothetical protein
MDGLMLVVTGVALALAVAMSFVAIRLLRGERNRSAARVSALESAALDLTPELTPDFADEDETLAYREPEYEVETAPVYREKAAPRYRDAAVSYREEAAPRYRNNDREIEIDVPAGPMFGATDEPKAPGRRWLALAAVAVVMAGVVGTLYVVFKPATVDASGAAAPSTEELTASTPPTSTVSKAAQSRPIELLSLKHSVDDGQFSLVGLVVNPIDANPLARVVAVVYLFDKEGAYFASGKAELEFTALRPGEESPFAIKIPNVAHIGKYRVGFRRDDGSVIAHVDKRGQRAGSMTEGGGDR